LENILGKFRKFGPSAKNTQKAHVTLILTYDLDIIKTEKVQAEHKHRTHNTDNG